MKSVIIIPARYASSRFPGKPLVSVCGQSMLSRVWRIACAVNGIDGVFVATDSEEIRRHIERLGASVVMTPLECRNGTERVYAALQSLSCKPEVIINLQGDAVLTPPWIIERLLDAMLKEPDMEIATPAVQLSFKQIEQLVNEDRKGIHSTTMVVFDKRKRALYFSRALIPNHRSGDWDKTPLYRHIGIYAYRYNILEWYLSLAPGVLEVAESLEQLRALENGIKISVVPVDYRGRTPGSIDREEDVRKVEEIILREGELLVEEGN